MDYLGCLRSDLRGKLCSLLDGPSIARLGATCRSWLAFASRNDVWGAVCTREGVQHDGSYEAVWRAIYILKKSPLCAGMPSHAFNFVHSVVSEQQLLQLVDVLDSSVKHQDKELSRVRLVRVLCDRTLSAGQRHKYPFLTQEGTEFYVRGRVGSAGSQAVLILTTHPNYHAEPLSSPDPAVPAMSFNMWTQSGAHALGYQQMALNIERFIRLYESTMSTARADDVFTRFYKDSLCSGTRGADLKLGPCSSCGNPVERFDHYFNVLEDAAGPRCTYAETGPAFKEQPWSKCDTCWPGDDAEEGVCSSCALVCHAGHKLVAQEPCKFYCDCGSGKGAPCKALGAQVCSDCARVARLAHSLKCVEIPWDLRLPVKAASCAAAAFVFEYVCKHLLEPFGRRAVNVSAPAVQHIYRDSVAPQLVYVVEVTFDADKAADMAPFEPSIEENRKHMKDVNVQLMVWVLDCGVIRSWTLDGTFVRTWTATQAKTDWKGIRETAFSETAVTFGGVGLSGLFDVTTGNTTNGQTGCCHTGTYVGSHAYRLGPGVTAWRVEQFMVKPMVVYEYLNRTSFSHIADF